MGEKNGIECTKTIDLTIIETEVVQAIRSLSYGSVRVCIEAGKPVRIVKEESVMLTKKGE